MIAIEAVPTPWVSPTVSRMPILHTWWRRYGQFPQYSAGCVQRFILSQRVHIRIPSPVQAKIPLNLQSGGGQKGRGQAAEKKWKLWICRNTEYITKKWMLEFNQGNRKLTFIWTSWSRQTRDLKITDITEDVRCRVTEIQGLENTRPPTLNYEEKVFLNRRLNRWPPPWPE